MNSPLRHHRFDIEPKVMIQMDHRSIRPHHHLQFGVERLTVVRLQLHADCILFVHQHLSTIKKDY